MNSKLRIAVIMTTCTMLLLAIPVSAQSTKPKSKAKQTQSDQVPGGKVDLEYGFAKGLGSATRGRCGDSQENHRRAALRQRS